MLRNGKTAVGSGGLGAMASVADAHLDHTAPTALPSTLSWDGLPFTADDAVRAHWTSKDAFPNAPTPLERFALGPTALLVAQSWALSDSPYLPSTSWWRCLSRMSDRGLARIVVRVAALVRGDPPVLDRTWREAWRELLLPRLLAEIERRRRRSARGSLPATPPIDVLETMQRLTGEQGRERRGETWFTCPWHEDRVPSLSVNAEKQIWHCFGCQRGGGWRKLQELVA